MKKSLTERSLTKAEIDKSEEIIKKLKGNKKDFVKRYGKDAEAVMYGRAVNMAKQQAENMENNKLKEMVKNALSKPKVEGKKVDMDKDGDIDSKDYLLKRDQAIKKSKGEMKEANMFVSGGNINPELVKKVEQFVKNVAKYYDYSVDDAFLAIMTILKGGLNKMNEDLDLGHMDNEPHHIKSELYQISKNALDLYDMISKYEHQGEVDFPAWWQSKITTAKTMMEGVKNYLEFELEEPNIDNNISFIDDSDMLNEVEIGDMVKIKKEYGGGRGEVEDKRGSFITVKGKSYHESDVEVIKSNKLNENDPIKEIAKKVAKAIKDSKK